VYLKDKDIFKDLKDCIQNLKEQSADTQKSVTDCFEIKSAKVKTKIMITTLVVVVLLSLDGHVSGSTERSKNSIYSMPCHIEHGKSSNTFSTYTTLSCKLRPGVPLVGCC
jgi:hypothetical protein